MDLCERQFIRRLLEDFGSKQNDNLLRKFDAAKRYFDLHEKTTITDVLAKSYQCLSKTIVKLQRQIALVITQLVQICVVLIIVFSISSFLMLYYRPYFIIVLVLLGLILLGLLFYSTYKKLAKIKIAVAEEIASCLLQTRGDLEQYEKSTENLIQETMCYFSTLQ